jgi:F-type H+-transporting ATPase subunit delta
MVTIPAVSGMMGILGEHAPTLAQLRPGVVTVHGNDIADVTHRYFVSGGFAEVKADSSASVQAVEAVKLDDLDAGQARKVLDESNAALAKAGSDLEKAQVQIQIEVAEAVLQALEQK